MTLPRHSQVDLSRTPYYHCISRCVRRAYLCGDDRLSGTNYDHRKQWLVDRMKFLSSLFAVDICAYAVLANHYHLVVHIHEERARRWSDDEVLRRWKRLFHQSHQKQAARTIMPDLNLWRERFASLSWYMRYMNESIARWANAEDQCTGRFWEGRFKSQALLDEGALLTCMTYVDLNPVRAGLSDRPENSAFTSIEERIHQYWAARRVKPKRVAKLRHRHAHRLGQGLMEFQAHESERNGARPVRLPVSRQAYFELVEWTGRCLREDKKGAIPAHLKPIMERLNLESDGWLEAMRHFQSQFFHAVGPAETMTAWATAADRCWLKGITAARRLYQKAA